MGVGNPTNGLHLSGKDLIVNSGNVYFDNRPFINGVPVAVSGDVPDIDFNNFATNSGLFFASGGLQNGLNTLNSAVSSISGSLNNLNILANGASIKSDYISGHSYIGRALVGSSDSDPVWTVTKIQISTSGTLSNQPQKATSAQWSNRYFLNYT